MIVDGFGLYVASVDNNKHRILPGLSFDLFGSITHYLTNSLQLLLDSLSI